MIVEAAVTVFEAKIIYADNSGETVERSTPCGITATFTQALERASEYAGRTLTEADVVRHGGGQKTYVIDKGVRSAQIIERHL